MDTVDKVETISKWQVEVLVTLQLIDQKLGFLLQALENVAFPPQMVGGPIPSYPGSTMTETVPPEPQVEYVDDPVLIKTFEGSEETVLLSSIEADNPKTARAIRIARALNEPFQAYVMNPEGAIGIIVGDGTKQHIERLRSSGQWV